MGRKSIRFAAVLVMLAACSDPGTGPDERTRTVRTDISVEIDWPLAREPWFVAWWDLQVLGRDDGWHKPCNFDDINCPAPSPIPVTVQERLFPSDGVARIRFTALCEPGTYQIGHDIDLYGRKKSVGQGWKCVYCGCTPSLPPVTCTDTLQRLTASVPSDDDRCSVEEWAETDVDLRLDWSLAREPGFAGARWTLLEREPDPDRLGLQWVAVDGGIIPEDGVAEVRFRTLCETGSDRYRYLNHMIEVSGHFVAYEDSYSDPECRLKTWNFECTGEPQIRTSFFPLGFGLSPEVPAQCTPPSAG